MTDAFMFAANAVLPIVITISFGYFLKRVGLFTKEFLDVGNKLTFRALLPAMLFYNVYGINSLGDIEPIFMLYCLGAILAVFIIAVGVNCLYTKDNAKRGALIQAAFRSNYAIIGLPLASALFGSAGEAAAGALSAFCIPMFNLLAVVTLTLFNGGNNVSERKKLDLKKLFPDILKNPLILATLSGLAVVGVRGLLVRFGIGFRLSDITFLYRALESIKSICTPFALLVLGGRFEFSAVKRLWKPILFGTVIRTIIVPAAALSAAYFLVPRLSGEHYASYIAVFATPCAVSGAIMAKEMGADEELAGQLVVWTSLVSTVTIFLCTAIFRAVGVF